MDQHTEELISVIVPVYNVERYLPQCLDSIIASTYHNLEIICINDASTDNSLNILRQYEKKDSRLEIIDFEHNKGQASARNQGLDIAKGKYLAFVDSDDFIAVSFFQTLYDQIIKEQSDIAVCGICEFDDETRTQKGEILKTDQSPLTEKQWWQLYRHKHTVIMNCVCNKLFRAECFINHRFKPGIIYEDTNLQHYLVQGKTISVNSEKLYYYRKRNNSTTTTTHSEKSLSRIQSLIDRAQYFHEKGWGRAKINTLQDAIKFTYQVVYKSDIDAGKVKSISQQYRHKIKRMIASKDWLFIHQKAQCFLILYAPDFYHSIRMLAGARKR